MKKVTRILVSMGIVGTLALNSSLAYAAEGNAEKADMSEQKIQQEAGMTPEHTFYFLDKFGEKFHLFFTRNTEKKATLYLTYATERLLESNKLADTSKDKYVSALMDAYTKNMEYAQENIKDVLLDKNVKEAIKNQLAANLETASTFVTDDAVDAALDDKKLLKLQNKKQEAYLVANMMKELDVDKVQAMHEEGLHFGEIVKVMAFAQESGKSEKEIVELLQSHDRKFGLVAKELRIEQTDIWRKVNERKINGVQKAYEKAIVSGNESEITRIGQKIDAISNEQVTIGLKKHESQRNNVMDKKLSIIEEKVAAGYITQQKADRITQNIHKNYDKQNSYESNHKYNEDKIVENKTKAQEKKAEKQLKEQNKTQDKAEKSAQKSKDKTTEQAKKDQEKTVDNDRKAKDKATEQAKKDQEKTADNDRKAKEKSAEQAQKAKEKANEQAKKEAEKAANNDRKAQEKAAEQAQKNEEKVARKAAEQAQKDAEKAAENNRKAQEKAAEQARKNQEKAAQKAAEQAQKNAEKAAKEREKQAQNNED